MYNNDHKEFDLKVRSMLEGAQESVPSGIWESISARLDVASAPVHKPSYWKWAAPAFAIAAAIAAILVVGRPSLTEPQLVSQVVAPVQTAEELQITELSGTQEEETPLVAQITTKTEMPKALTPEEPEQEAAMKSEPKPEPKLEPEQSPAGSESPAQTQTKPQIQSEITDPFSIQIIKEKRPRLATLEIKGALATNDSQFGSRNFVNHLAPGSGSGNKGIQETSTSVYGIPFTLGLGARVNLGTRFSMGTGLNYSLLTRSFTGTYTKEDGNVTEGDIDHTMHYVGIPLNAYYNLFNGNNIKFYMGIGGSAEYCVSNKYRPRFLPDTIISEKVNSLQLSAGLNLGVEFRLTELLGVYFDPSIRYYFDCDQPKSIRTDRPLMINLEAGLRFNL